MIFQGIWTSIARKPYIFVIFQGGGSQCSPPSGFAHAKGWMNNGHWNWKIKESSPFGCFVWVDALLPSQWFFSHPWTYSELNQYYKQRIKFLAEGHNRGVFNNASARSAIECFLPEPKRSPRCLRALAIQVDRCIARKSKMATKTIMGFCEGLCTQYFQIRLSGWRCMFLCFDKWNGTS